MSDNLNLLRNIIDYLESYQNEVGNSDLREFSIYLKDRVLNSEKQSTSGSFNTNNFSNYKQYQEVEFSTLLTGLYRFAKHYSKKAFANTSINSIDEFGFLATLLKDGTLLKNELINKNLIEISSGSEIIKRLTKGGFIDEIADEKDKRAKRINISEKGRIEIMKAFAEMHKVSEIVIGNLDSAEITEALSIFNKLTFYHNHIHETDRNSNLNELHSKYVSSRK